MADETHKISQILRNSALVVGDSLNLDAVLDSVLSAVRQVVAYDAASIMLLFEDRVSVVRYVADSPPKQSSFLVDEVPHFRHIIKSKLPTYIPNIEKDVNWINLIGTEWIRSYIGLPIFTKDIVYGVLNVDGKQPNQFTESDLYILQVFAAQVGLAIRNANLFQNLQTLTHTLEERVEERTHHLSQLRTRVETILNHTSDAMLLTDSELRIVQANFAFEQLFQRETDEQFNQPLQMLIAPSHREQFHTLFNDPERFPELDHLETVVLRKDGIELDVVLSLAEIDSLDVPGYVCTIHDITDSKQMLSALQISEARSRSILDAALDCIISFDSEGKFIEFNPAAERTFGYSREEVLGRSMGDLIMPNEFRQLGHKGMIEFFTDYESQIFNRRLELQARRADGTDFPIEITIVPVETNDRLFFTAYLRDITERQQAEQALINSEAKFKAVFESSNDGIILHDFDGIILDVNHRVMDLLYYSEYELIGSNLLSFHAESEHQVVTAAQKTVFAEGRVQYQVEFQRQDGTCFPAEVSASLTRINDQQIVQSVVRDITKRVKAEQELRESLEREREVNELKSRFVAMASHELRTPLATILSSTELLSAYFDELTREEFQERFRRIESQVQHMTNLLEGVLTVGKIDAGTYVFRPRQLNLVELAQEILEDIHVIYQESHQIDFNWEGEQPYVFVDAQLIRQTVSNLLTNAIKYSPRGSLVRFRVAINEDSVNLEVHDQGIGIPEEDQPQLFQRFHRATNTTGISGTGLGLSIVKHAVDLHSGTITFESQVSKGTSFYISIPRASEDNHG